MQTSNLDWQKRGSTHRHNDGLRYSIDALIDILLAKPRPVETLDLDGWSTTRERNGFGVMESVLIGPDGTDHQFIPTKLREAKRFPIIVCRRGRTIIIVDGIHRVVRALRAKQKSYPCVYVTLRELKKCQIKTS